MKKLVFGLMLVVLMAIPLGNARAVTNPIEGKMIALDAGHEGTDTGAYNSAYNLAENDVNLAVVLSLKTKLELAGATVVLTREGNETIDSRKSRVDIAKEKCASYSKECDILISVHHNGSYSPVTDGTMVIYNEKQDKPLAFALHDSLVNSFGLPDLGYDNGGYGITVHGHLVSALTESYFVTNNNEAYQFLYGNRNGQEVQALYDGISYYFLNKPTKRK